MATSSSDEGSIPPKDFQQLSSSTDSGSRLSPNRRKCPLCLKFRKTFHCRECVQNGLFASSNLKSTDRFVDKQSLLVEAEDNRRKIERNCLRLLEARQKEDVLRTKIRHSKDRNKILKLAVEEKKQRNLNMIKKATDLKADNLKRRSNLPKYEQKVQQIENFVTDRREKIEKSRKILEQKQIEIKRLVKLRLQQLFKYVFPINKITPQTEMEPVESDMVSALAEASQTTYIRDRWEYTGNTGEMKYSIVAPTLPSTGNYSAYNVWVAQNNEGTVTSNTTMSVEHNNPALTINAALTYTAQCVNVLSFYLNVRLPHKMMYSDFCGTNMNQQQFARKVARLNANILYLCFTQNVDLCSLRSCETIHNILQLIENESADLGRQGPIEVDIEKATALEEPLANDLQICEDSDSEEGDSFPVEWEAVPHVQCPEAAAGTLNIQSTQMISTQQASSVAGGLVNSAAASIVSIWRGFGFTGR